MLQRPVMHNGGLIVREHFFFFQTETERGKVGQKPQQKFLLDSRPLFTFFSVKKKDVVIFSDRDDSWFYSGFDTNVLEATLWQA